MTVADRAMSLHNALAANAYFKGFKKNEILIKRMQAKMLTINEDLACISLKTCCSS